MIGSKALGHRLEEANGRILLEHGKSKCLRVAGCSFRSRVERFGPEPGRAIGFALAQTPSVVGLDESSSGISNRLQSTAGLTPGSSDLVIPFALRFRLAFVQALFLYAPLVPSKLDSRLCCKHYSRVVARTWASLVVA